MLVTAVRLPQIISGPDELVSLGRDDPGSISVKAELLFDGVRDLAQDA